MKNLVFRSKSGTAWHVLVDRVVAGEGMQWAVAGQEQPWAEGLCGFGVGGDVTIIDGPPTCKQCIRSLGKLPGLVDATGAGVIGRFLR